ncbi:hypothetical protein MSAN_01437800 [Mycena sanguinolenta]|uniref:Uncharacterized protein n=1 Tax=Mycena sanguinolenta TaxID=230812 RepID=A0A8H6YBU9_9AGAR|nr:hypothetical protein MSAN_01437800 [Mycena sanguinolenta]
MSASSNDDLLQILNAHGQEFLSSFSLPAPTSSKKRKSTESSSRPTKVAKLESPPESDEEEEWTGIQVDESESEEASGSDFEQEDDEFTSAPPTNEKVVVFSETGRPGPSGLPSLAQKKAFMSSKVTKLREEPGVQQPESSAAEDEEERTNVQNDALLHRLVHTKLLSGSLNADLNMTPAHRRKALAGRVLELSGQAKLGKGERSVREGERNKASKRVREGMLDKQKRETEAAVGRG